MEREIQAPGEYYHICGRGDKKQTLFRHKRDYLRFIFNILYLQSDRRFYNTSRYVDYYEDSRDFRIDNDVVAEIAKDRHIELAAFCLMPNHYHLIVKNISEKGVSKYMHRVLIGFANYFNTKYDDVSGHVFEGAYNLIHISSDAQLQYLFSYVHKNPKELPKWRNNYWDYTWSSCRDLAGNNRWGDLLSDEIIRDQFSDFTEYKKFLQESSAKGGFEPPQV
ncbi:MAG: transposase [Candidatus Paceibacterota bacterium]